MSFVKILVLAGTDMHKKEVVCDGRGNTDQFIVCENLTHVKSDFFLSAIL